MSEVRLSDPRVLASRGSPRRRPGAGAMPAARDAPRGAASARRIRDPLHIMHCQAPGQGGRLAVESR